MVSWLLSSRRRRVAGDGCMKKDPVSLHRGVHPHFLQREVTESDKLLLLCKLLYRELLNHESGY